MRELQIRHQQGTNFVDERAPTGYAYQQQQPPAQPAATTQAVLPTRNTEPLDDSDDDEWLDDDDDDDPILEAMRQKRLHELQQARKAPEQVRTIAQDEFLAECRSDFVAVHFFHNDYERCKVMDHHWQKVAALHTSCKFLRIDAAKAPFFVTKLQVRVLPTVIVFREGKVVARLIGFEGLASPTNDPDAWETSSLQRWLASTGAIQYDASNEDDDENELGVRRSNRVVHRGLVSTGVDDF